MMPGDGENVACDVTPRALVLAVEHGGKGGATIVRCGIGSLLHFAIRRRPTRGVEFEPVAYTDMRRSHDRGADASRAFEAFEQCCRFIRTGSGTDAP
jgi:hypothetical protein